MTKPVQKKKTSKHNTRNMQNYENNFSVINNLAKFELATVIFGANFYKRLFFTMIMILLFVAINFLSSTYLMLFVIILTICILIEIMTIGLTSEGYPINIYLIFVFCFTIYFYYLSDVLIYLHPSTIHLILLFRRAYFCIYISFIILFVCLLKNGMLRKQFAMFSLIHLGSYVVANCCRSALRNINLGKFWLFFPSTLVICNDIFAYVFGKWIGNTPIFALSPKKTLEGFLGGFVCTALYGFVLSYIQHKYCIFTNIYENEFSNVLNFNFVGHTFSVYSIYVHCFVFIMIASFVAPFSGFFASALKRMYNKKDFGNTIPGHGGFTDRFDCQCIMVIFTTVYLKSFLKTKTQSLQSCFYHVAGTFKVEEIEMLISMLNAYVDTKKCNNEKC